MANQEQPDLFQQEAMETWKRRRLTHPDLLLNLDGAYITQTDLNHANLSYALLRDANLPASAERPPHREAGKSPPFPYPDTSLARGALHR